MQLEHSFSVPVGVDRAWEVLTDVETIAPCMPGAALDTIDGDEFTGTVKVKLGPIGLTYKGKASFVEKDADAHRAVIDAQGRDARGNGTAKAKVTATLQSESAESTKVVVSTDLAITGKPAQFGRGVMVDVGNKLIGQFADCLAGKLTAPAETVEQEEPATAPAATAGGAAASGSSSGAGSPSAGPQPSASAQSPGTAGAAAAPTPSADNGPKHAASNGSGPAPTGTTSGPASAVAAGAGTGGGAAGTGTASSGPRKVAPTSSPEPIDLMASAGPAVAKRLVPVAVGAVAVVAAIVWWRRR